MGTKRSFSLARRRYEMTRLWNTGGQEGERSSCSRMFNMSGSLKPFPIHIGIRTASLKRRHYRIQHVQINFGDQKAGSKTGEAIPCTNRALSGRTYGTVFSIRDRA